MLKQLEASHPLVMAFMWALIPPLAAFLIASGLTDAELKKAVYMGAATLLFGGLLGGVLKLLLGVEKEPRATLQRHC